MNFRQLSGLALCAAVLVNLSSCTKANDDKIIDAGNIQQNSKLTSSQKAEQLAKAAEQLISVQGFAYADEVADLALQNDSSNLRAQFIKSMLGPIMVNQGIVARVLPLVSKDYETLDKYNESLLKSEKDMPNSTLKTFLKNGSADIKDEKDVQDYINATADSYKAIRVFAKNNKNSELTVMAADGLYQSMINRYAKSCEVVEVSKYQYKTNCPAHTNILEIKLNRADFEAIQMAASGYEIAYSLYNSYNLSGAIDKALSLKGKKNVDGETVIKELLQNKEFATLRSGNGFSRIKEMGLDAISGMRFVIQNQDTLCALGRNNAKNRIGMLFNEGLCSTDEKETRKTLVKIEEALNGKLYNQELVMDDKSVHNTVVNPVALLDSPVADLRSVAPTAFDNCGRAVAIQDVTLSGILVNGDANIILAKQSDCSK